MTANDESLKMLTEIQTGIRKLTDRKVTRNELAEIFGVTPGTIDSYVRSHGLKRLKNGRFPVQDSLDWLYDFKERKKK